LERNTLLKRADGRSFDQLRPVKISTGYQAFAEGSALIELGKTRVLCAVTCEDRVPPFLRNSGTGWVTAEYSMLPRSTVTRTERDSGRGGISGRSQEIQRLIGRCLRAVTDMTVFGERTFIVDCDVLQADGGTRTASVTGAYVALYIAMEKLAGMGVISSVPLKSAVAATSVGIVHGYRLLDLCYDEDYNAEADMNVVMTGRGEFVEIQGTAEKKPFGKESVDVMLGLADKGIKELFALQQAAIESARKR
jgi:ribonuclease PH